MARAKKISKSTRKRYSDEFKAEALGLAQSVGVAQAARELGLYPSQLYGWRSTQKARGSQSETERKQATEIARLKRLVAEQDEELAIVKKSGCIFRKEPEVKYAFMKSHSRQFRTVAMARVLGVSRNGSPRLTRDLADDGYHYDRKTVATSMKRQNLVAKAGRKFKATTLSDHNLPVAPNLLKQDFAAERPNEKYVGDITYLWTDEGWLYLAVVLDLYSGKVIGWAMDKRMKSKLVCDALTMALWRRGKPCSNTLR